MSVILSHTFFFFQAEDGIRDFHVTGVQTCALPILPRSSAEARRIASTVSGFMWPPWAPITSAATPATWGAEALVPKLTVQPLMVGPTTVSNAKQGRAITT